MSMILKEIFYDKDVINSVLLGFLSIMLLVIVINLTL